MEWLNNILSSGVDKVVDSVGNAIDKVVTSDEERLQLKFELEKAKAEALANVDNSITDRWRIDAGSESWLTRNIRPLTLGWSVSTITFIAIADAYSTNFTMDMAYIDLFKTLLVTMVVAYFGSRGFEKIKGGQNG